MTVNHRQVDALGIAPAKMIPKFTLSVRSGRENDQAGSIAIDPMHDERSPLSVRAQVQHELILHRRGVFLTLQRDCQKTRWLVHDNQRLVFIDDA